MPINAPNAPLANTGTLGAVARRLLMCSGRIFQDGAASNSSERVVEDKSTLNAKS